MMVTKGDNGHSGEIEMVMIVIKVTMVTEIAIHHNTPYSSLA